MSEKESLLEQYCWAVIREGLELDRRRPPVGFLRWRQMRLWWSHSPKRVTLHAWRWSHTNTQTCRLLLFLWTIQIPSKIEGESIKSAQALVTAVVTHRPPTGLVGGLVVTTLLVTKLPPNWVLFVCIPFVLLSLRSLSMTLDRNCQLSQVSSRLNWVISQYWNNGVVFIQKEGWQVATRY